jgi:Tol biopolymer transport system component
MNCAPTAVGSCRGVRLALVWLAVLLAALVVGQPAYGQELTDKMAYGPFGTIVSPHGAGVMLTDVATGLEESIAVLPPVGINGHTAWSPDRTRLAISRFSRRPGDRIGGSDILVVPAAGGEALPVAEHAQDGALLGALAWMPDSSGVYYDALSASGDPLTMQVVFSPLDPSAGGPRVVADGGWPSVSPDGRLLAHVRPSHQSGYLNELVVTDLTSGSERILVPMDQMVQVTSPRFSPDGAEIAFVGSDVGPQALGGPGRSDQPDTLFGSDLFAKGVMNHGPPGDIYVISASGGAPHRLTSFEEDDPTLAWSPDGYWLAMLAGGGLYLMPRDLSEGPHLLSRGGFGGIDWR